MIEADLVDFGNTDLPHRLLHGGLPSFFLSPEPPERDFQEWMDAYWARDIQELFRLERRASFQRFFELLLAQSGDLFEVTLRLATAAGVLRYARAVFAEIFTRHFGDPPSLLSKIMPGYEQAVAENSGHFVPLGFLEA